MRRDPAKDPGEDLEGVLRAAFTAEDSEAAWYFDRVAERAVRVRLGETNIPDLPAEEVEEDEDRYVEVPAVTESEVHAWMEEFVLAHPEPKVATLLDERHGANERFLKKLAAASPDWLRDWNAFHAARVEAAYAEWRASVR